MRPRAQTENTWASGRVLAQTGSRAQLLLQVRALLLLQDSDLEVLTGQEATPVRELVTLKLG